MRTYIIEDDSLLLELVRSFVTSLSEIDLVGEAMNGQKAMHDLIELKPELVLTDIIVPDVDGMEILYLIKRKLPDTHVVVFTGSSTPDKIRLAYKGGADAFIEKGSGLAEFDRAIQAIKNGKRYFDQGSRKILAPMISGDISELEG